MIDIFFQITYFFYLGLIIVLFLLFLKYFRKAYEKKFKGRVVTLLDFAGRKKEIGTYVNYSAYKDKLQLIVKTGEKLKYWDLETFLPTDNIFNVTVAYNDALVLFIDFLKSDMETHKLSLLPNNEIIKMSLQDTVENVVKSLLPLKAENTMLKEQLLQRDMLIVKEREKIYQNRMDLIGKLGVQQANMIKEAEENVLSAGQIFLHQISKDRQGLLDDEGVPSTDSTETPKNTP